MGEAEFGTAAGIRWPHVRHAKLGGIVAELASHYVNHSENKSIRLGSKLCRSRSHW
jgi:hypothetical protein